MRERAAEALGMLAGVKDATGFVFDRMKRVGFRRLSKPQKVYYCVWLLNAEVRNGGFAQYFVNPSGNLAHLSLKALRVLGATHAEQTLARAMDIFGASGPSRNQDERHEQLAVLYDQNKSHLSALDDAFSEDLDNLAVRLKDFARRYKKHFGARRR
ncbi:MAG TPA: DMP19 family protein [Gemmataceae bacterium]|nr:DMP19 family protein [Gemmataceae bacterium]